VFSERDLTFKFDICYPSVVCLSVTFMRLTQPVEIFGNVSSPFGTLAIRSHSVKIIRRSSQGIPSVGGRGRLTAKGVAKYSDFGDLGGHILETVQDRR